MKQMDRRLLILMRLREETPVTARELAELCECSVRTIYRDIDALCAAGVPVAAMAGEGYRVVEGYHLPPIAFSAEEVAQLLLGADVAARLATPAQREALRTAAAKIEAVLDAPTRAEVDRRRERIVVPAWAYRDPSPWLPLLVRAVLEGAVVHLRYRSWGSDEITERNVEPLRLLFYSDDWHLVAYCRLREAVRDFRLARVLDAQVLTERIAVEPVPIEEHGDEELPIEVRVWLDERVVPWAREQPPFLLVREEPAEGGAVFVIRCGESRSLLAWVLRWGAAARVLSPPDLVIRVRDEAGAMLELYGGD